MGKTTRIMITINYRYDKGLLIGGKKRIPIGEILKNGAVLIKIVIFQNGRIERLTNWYYKQVNIIRSNIDLIMSGKHNIGE
jgi:hypothetical protein